MSLTATMIDAMLAAGCTAEQIAAVVKADLAADQERKARHVPWLALRKLAFDRDGLTCTYCGGQDGPWEIDHIIPRAKGGENTLDNVTVSCRRCNRSKKDREAPKHER